MTIINAASFAEEHELNIGDYTTDARLLWCDIETTGLNVETDVVLEVGFIITDKWGALLADPMKYFIQEADQKVWDARKDMPAFVRKMHTDSGLLAEYDTSPTYGGAYIAQRVLLTLEQCTANSGDMKQILFAGSTVNFDRNFIQRLMPDLHKSIHHRNRDVSSLKEMCVDFNPDVYARLADQAPKMGKHRVLEDLVDSIKEYNFYVDNFLFHTWEGE